MYLVRLFDKLLQVIGFEVAVTLHDIGALRCQNETMRINLVKRKFFSQHFYFVKEHIIFSLMVLIILST